MAIRISTNSLALTRQLKALPERQLPFARSLIANRMAQRVRNNERAVLLSRIDRPTRWTLNGLYLKAGNKAKPEARVWFKDFAPKGTPAGDYLQPLVFSGERKQKRSERALMHMGYMKPGQFLVPGQGAQLDAHGNMKKGRIVQILSALRAFGQQGYLANARPSARSMRNQARSGANRYFFGTINGQDGVWQRVDSAFGGGARPILMVHDSKPRYRAQFPFFAVAENTVAAHYAKVAEIAINEVLRTARP